MKPKKIAGICGHMVFVGVWHFVSFEKPTPENVRQLRKTNFANLTFVKKSGRAVTFENGVEAFTKSCGTGAVAASIVLGLKNIRMPGGELQVDVRGQRISLSGPVRRTNKKFVLQGAR